MRRGNVSAGVWIGRIVSALVVLVLLADAGVDLFKPELVKPEMDMSGLPVALATPLGIILLVCAALYAIPQTAVLGAILVTGFFGGAICTHFRIGEMGSMPQVISFCIAMLAWGGLYLRDPRVRALLPFRSRP